MAQYDYAFKGDAPGLRMWVAEHPGHVNDLSSDRKTSLLYTCARFGHESLVRFLVDECGADVNLANGENRSTPLHGACFGGHHAIVAFLVSRGASVSALNAYGEKPEHNARKPSEGVSATDGAECVRALHHTPLSAPPRLPPPPPLPPAVSPKKAAPAAGASEGPEPSPLAVARWEKLKLAELRSECTSRGLAATGNKDALVLRLALAAPDGPAAPVSPSKAVAPPAAAPAVTDDAPAAKKPKPEAEQAATHSDGATASAATEATTGPLDPAWLEKLRGAAFTLTAVERDTEAFWDLEERVMAWQQGRNDDYVKNRLKKKLKPIVFIVKAAWKVSNPVLEAAFEAKRAEIKALRGDANARVRVAFHGTSPGNIDSICRTSVLRFRHPLNPSKTQSDDGYFGSCLSGCYVSRYFEYCAKYCNQLKPLEPDQSCRILMFRCVPGLTKTIEAVSMGMAPTPGYDSHTSANALEWYVFDERQLCPDYVIEIQAKEDSRTAADDE